MKYSLQTSIILAHEIQLVIRSQITLYMSLSNLKASHRVLNSHIFCIDRGTEVSFGVALAVFSENGPFVCFEALSETRSRDPWPMMSCRNCHATNISCKIHTSA